MLRYQARRNPSATWMHVVVALLLSASTCARAQDADLGAGETATSRAEIRKIVEHETARTNLPADIVEAVVFVESGYNPAVVGSAGELGLMQLRLETAAALGFRGNAAELAEPDINIHYGVLHLSRAWRLAGGDLCRTLMKYRASQDEDETSPRSQVYCNRARNRLSRWARRRSSPLMRRPHLRNPHRQRQQPALKSPRPGTDRRSRPTSMPASAGARPPHPGPFGPRMRPGSAASRPASRQGGSGRPRVNGRSSRNGPGS
ncbi:transglycosylase SLT domain-containing protein [Bradyrhizobium guangzhouense]|uniref:transglycosylase SLT domain-containing protein n=1 Tax=Bradyrhizobium guangzhouense TaxID=1325095 RepID=UPI001FDEE3AE|nr:transglycosylase SLT domain-containing protein [Bradyrhizobium guangzhouense]